MEAPSSHGFPHVVRIPIGVFTEPPPEDAAWIHGQHVDDWAVAPVPIQSYSKPLDYFRAIARAVALAERMGTLMPW